MTLSSPAGPTAGDRSPTFLGSGGFASISPPREIWPEDDAGCEDGLQGSEGAVKC